MQPCDFTVHRQRLSKVIDALEGYNIIKNAVWKSRGGLQSGRGEKVNRI